VTVENEAKTISGNEAPGGKCRTREMLRMKQKYYATKKDNTNDAYSIRDDFFVSHVCHLHAEYEKGQKMMRFLCYTTK
jgi:hypothetical protein